MIDVEDLLKPIADGQPCGEDFSYHPSLQALETLTQGTPDVEIGGFKKPAEEPDWKEVRQQAMDVLSHSKHLTPGVILTVSLLRTEGLEGFRDGLAVVRGMTEKYWPQLYPKLDPDDNNDPTERLNILHQLSSAGKPYQILAYLKQVVVCSAPSMGRITLQQIITAKERATIGSSGQTGAPGPDLNQIQAAFREAGPDAATATFGLVTDVIRHVEGIETFLETTLGAGNGVNFEALNKLLTETKETVEPHAAQGAAASAASTSEIPAASNGGVAQSAPRSGPGMSGMVQSRADVLKALDLICDYYREREPSSPVPLLLQRAQRLVDKDFMSIITDLNPDALRQLELITGAKPKE